MALCADARAEPTGDIRGEVLVVRRSLGSESHGPEDVIVFLEDAKASVEAPKGPFVMEQSGKAFRPSVLVVPRGASVEFPNRDVFQHNIFSVSAPARFDLGLYEPGASRKVTFAEPGIVAVYCNIHPQMVGYVVVVTNPFFTRPAPDGSFSLKGVPPGTYRLVSWFPFGKASREEVRVTAGGTTLVKTVVREKADASRHARKDGGSYVTY